MLAVSWDTIRLFLVHVATGIWNIAATPTQVSHDGSYRTTLIVKLVVVLISGVTAALHIRSRTPRGRAILGALTGLSAWPPCSSASSWPDEQVVTGPSTPYNLAAPHRR